MGASTAKPATVGATTCTRPYSLEDGCDIRTVQELLGHGDVATTMAFLNLLDVEGLRVASPADGLSLQR